MDIKVELISNKILLLEPKTDSLDASNVFEFRKQVYGLIEPRKSVVCDLKHIQFVDSSGLGALIFCQKTMRARGGNFRLCGLTPAVKTLFDLMRMERVFETYSHRNEALVQLSNLPSL